MKQEIEVKFLDVNHETIREKLRQQGGECEQPMRLMRRCIMDFPDRRLQTERDAFIRVRDEGNKVTLTYKQFSELSVNGVHEIELTVNSFDDTVALMEQLGLKSRSLQESKRETWKLGDTEIMLDEWPWLKPYIEIEADDEAALKVAAHKLGMDYSKAVAGDVMVAYRAQYPHLSEKQTVGTIEEVRFEAPLPSLLIA